MSQRGKIITECILCGKEKNNTHLLLCTHRVDVIILAVQNFQLYLDELKTDPLLTTTLINQISKYLGLPNSVTQPPLLIPRAYGAADTSQKSIGWTRFFRGYLTNDWAALQEQHYKKQGSTKLGDHLSAKVSMWWIKQCHKIWMDRNDCVYNKKQGLQSRMEEEVFAQVQQIYTNAELLSTDDRVMLDMPITDRLLQPINSLQQWVNITLPTITTCINYVQQNLRHRNQQITSFFPWRDVRIRRTSPGQSTSTTFLPWRDTKNRHTVQHQQDDQSEATPDNISAPNNSQESLSSCRKRR